MKLFCTSKFCLTMYSFTVDVLIQKCYHKLKDIQRTNKDFDFSTLGFYFCFALFVLPNFPAGMKKSSM